MDCFKLKKRQKGNGYGCPGKIRIPSFEALFHTRLIMNDVIRFVLTCLPAKDPFQNCLGKSFPISL
jgi:hypothetical protein